ncbi:TolC family protein [Variovorax terrae]|uniref:TolC family protein n=1 Tax=Variovorax terrae TaxID=2923278 RepID=A0A9X2AQ59_9BURK|nr:TolC family protein [Variovorax terrae]MCJ0765635.1 TolC family protein [Variovorax terrae]
MALACQAHAQADRSLTLGQTLQAARNNLDVALARHALTASQADITAANHAPLPVLTAKMSAIDLQNGVGGGNVLRDKRIDKSIGLDWTWERGNKRELRTLAAQRAADAAKADVDDVQTQQLLAAHAAYFDLLAAQERLEQVSAIERSAAQLATTAARRVRAGDLAAQDEARTSIEAQRALADVQAAQLERQRAALALALIIGREGDAGALTARGDWPALDAAAASPADFAALVDARPEVRAAQARVQAAQAVRDGTEALKRNDITWGASLDHYPGTSTRLLELRLQMPLQWGYSYQGEIGRAQAQYAQAQDALEKTRRAAGNEMLRLQQEAMSSAQRAQGYQGGILPRARQVAESAETAYNKGALSLTDLLDARRTLRATQLDALDARTDFAKAAGAWQLRTRPEALLAPTP